MEINVTDMVNGVDCSLLSGSRFEFGEDAGQITWRNAMAWAAEHPLLSGTDQIVKAKRYFRSFGAWSGDEIAAWSDLEVQAMVVQEAASCIREMERFDSCEEYQDAAERGQVTGNLWRSSDGQWYLYLGM